MSDEVSSDTIDTLPLEINGASLLWTSSNNDIYTINNGQGYTNRLHQKHIKQYVDITLTVTLGEEQKIFSKNITINPVLFDEMVNPKAVYFAVGSASNFTNNSIRYKTDKELFSTKFKNNIDIVYYASATLDNSGNVYLDDKYMDKVLELKNYGARIVLVLNGAESTYLENLTIVCDNDLLRTALASNIMDKVVEYNLDGVDIDWEFPGTSNLGEHYTTERDQVNMNKLLKELRQEMNSRQDSKGSTYLLSAAIPATSWGSERYKWTGDEELGGINDYCDYVNMMSYDLNKTTHSSHQTPLYSSSVSNNYSFGVDYGVNRFVELGLDKSKIIIGCAAYGKTYSLSGTSVSVSYPGLGVSGTLCKIPSVTGSFSSGTIYYSEIASLLSNPSYVQYDEYNTNNEFVGSYLYNESLNLFITYESSTSAAYKALYAKSNGLGIMLWAYGEDTTETIINSIFDNM